MMRVLILLACCLGLTASLRADESGEFRLIQARQILPRIELWLELPVSSSPKAEQFSVTLGTQNAEVHAIDSFNQTGEGVAYIFLVDVSRSLTQLQFLQIQGALRHWSSGLGAKDRAAVLSFGSEVKQHLAFTADPNQLNTVIDSLAPTDKDTQLYQGLLEAIAMGHLQDADLPARRAIIVLSDGIDDALNGVTLEEVQKQSIEYRVPIYSIGFPKPPLDDNKRQGLKILGLLARQSGGRFVQAEAGQLEQAYAQQHRHIMQAYRLSLQCQDCVADGQLRRLNVTWSHDAHIVSDGMELRLLPTTSSLREQDVFKFVPMMVAPLGFLIFLGVLWWLYRQRLERDSSDDKLFELIEASSQQDQKPRLKGMTVCLTVVTGVDKGREYRLDVVESVLVGRSESCALCVVGDSEVSNQHLMLRQREGGVWVRDLNSTNGTWVNGVPIHNEYPLRNDDLLLLGRTELRVTGLG